MTEFISVLKNLHLTSSIKKKRKLLESYFKNLAVPDLSWAVYILCGHDLTWTSKDNYCRETCGENESLSEWMKNYYTPSRLAALVENRRYFASKIIVENALADHLDLAPATVARRLKNSWKPGGGDFIEMLCAKHHGETENQYYPFILPRRLSTKMHECDLNRELGAASDWLVEPLAHSLRVQLVKRKNQVSLWTARRRPVTETFKQIVHEAMKLADGTVLDGEISSLGGADFFTAIDCLEDGGVDIRDLPLSQRTERLIKHFKFNVFSFLKKSPAKVYESWFEIAKQRASGVSLLLRRKGSRYEVGRGRRHWFKWNAEPRSIDAVLLFAARGRDEKKHLYSEYTFAVWQNGELVPIAQAKCGLDDHEVLELDRLIHSEDGQKFGHLKKLAPSQVFEITFDHGKNCGGGFQDGPLRHSKILRWKRQALAQQATRLDELNNLIM